MPQSGRLQANAHATALELKVQGLLNSRDLQLVQAYVSHNFQALKFCYSVVLACKLWITCRGQFGSTVPDHAACLQLHVYVFCRTLHKAMTC